MSSIVVALVGTGDRDLRCWIGLEGRFVWVVF